MADKTTKTYFPNLDGLRFLGSVSILLFHIENLKSQNSLEPIPWIHYFSPLGNLSVSMFFVLSGFLITFFLLREKENTSTINLKQFYINRILKIWPLYFLIGFIGFVILPALDDYFYGDYSRCLVENTGFCVLAYCLFIPIITPSETIGATWSVRVEEAFYLFWPLLIRASKNYVKLFVWIVVIVVLGRNAIIILAKHSHIHLLKVLALEAVNYRVSCMALGGLGAYICIQGKQRILSVIYRKYVQFAIYCLTSVLLFFKVNVPYINFEVYSMLFAIIIVNLATNPNSIITLEAKWMKYLGKISYGLYLYNPIMRILSLELIERLFRNDLQGWLMNTLLYITTIASTILISGLSYKYFEKPFLRLKNRFRPFTKVPAMVQ